MPLNCRTLKPTVKGNLTEEHVLIPIFFELNIFIVIIIDECSTYNGEFCTGTISNLNNKRFSHNTYIMQQKIERKRLHDIFIKRVQSFFAALLQGR